jgi:hypothetical protein
MVIKDIIKRREYNNEYQKVWRENNKEKWKEIQNKAESKQSRIDYRKNWWNESPKAKLIKERFKENHPEAASKYSKEYIERNPERNIKKYEKYYSSIKGIINRLKKSDKKRFNIDNNELTIELITYLDNKYKNCIYCGGEFKPRFDYDHINPFKPFSKKNIIKVCSKCNQSKNNANLLDWMNFKGYKITEEIEELYKNSLL